jgi:sulfite exporter TauE/SafE
MTPDTLPLLGAVLAASVLGSTHCAGMCGAFALIAVSDDLSAPTGARRWTQTACYNSGRLTTYVLFGALAGIAGAALDLGGSMVGVQRAALMLAACTMLVIAAVRIAQHCGAVLPRSRTPIWLLACSRRAHEQVFALPPSLRAFGVGTLTTLLPCGWLYTFVIAAAGTGSAVTGSLLMATFWLGTLPIMAAIGIGARSLFASLSPRASILTSLLLAAAALWTLSGRATLLTSHQHANTSQDRKALAAPACNAPSASTLVGSLRGEP